MPEGDKTRRRKTPSEPYLGIFWLVKNSLIIEAEPFSQGEDYGENLTYPGSHIDVWRRLQAAGRVPQETEYEEFARGRIVYQTRTREFFILADRCILERPGIVGTLKKSLHLPDGVKLGTDDHYRCHECLYGVRHQENEDDD